MAAIPSPGCAWSSASAALVLALGGCGRLGFDAHLACSGAEDCDFDPASAQGDDVDAATAFGSDGGSPSGAGRDGSTPGSGTGDPQGSDAGGTLPPEGKGPPCGSMELVRDDFSRVRSDGFWYALAHGPAEAAVEDGHLTLRLSGTASDVQMSYHASQAHDLRNSQLSFALAPGSAQRSGLELRDGKGLDRFNQRLSPDARGVALVVEGGRLRALTLAGDAETELASAPYDEETQRFLRVREQQGTLSWESSADRSTWQRLHAASVAMDVSSVFATLVAASDGQAGEARFDDVNMPTRELPGYCGTSSLRDDFTGAELGAAWLPWNGAGSCTVREQSGRVTIDFAGEFSACALRTTHLFDLRDDSVFFELAGVPDRAFTSYAELYAPFVNERVEVRFSEGVASLSILRDEQPLYRSTTPYHPDVQRLWRFRESDGTLYWESSSDAAAWRLEAQAPTQVDLSAVIFDVWGVEPNSTAGQVQLTVERVNAP